MSSVTNNSGGGWFNYLLGGEEDEHNCDDTCDHEKEISSSDGHLCNTACDHDKAEEMESSGAHKCDTTCSHEKQEVSTSSNEHACHDYCSHRQSFWSYWTGSGIRKIEGEENYCVVIGDNGEEGIDGVPSGGASVELYEQDSEYE